MPYIDVEIVSATAVVTLNDPDTRNALSSGLVAELVAAVDEVEGDPAVRAVVLTGAGSAFCAGADLTDLLAASRGEFDRVERVYESFLRVRRSTRPTIAAVNGPAVGAGFNLALACDLRIVSSNAYFESRFARLGLHPGGASSWMLARAAGSETATAALLFDEVIDAARAVQSGLAWRCVEAGALLETAVELASRVGRASSELRGYTKDTLARAFDLDHRQALELETERQRWSFGQPDVEQRLTRIARTISKTPRGDA